LKLKVLTNTHKESSSRPCWLQCWCRKWPGCTLACSSCLE